MYLFYNFRDPEHLERERPVRPFAVSWQNGAEVFRLGLQIDFEALPSRCEVFYVFTDMPHGKFRNDKVKRVLGWTPREDVAALWQRPTPN
jgi:hypothetical protein